MNETKHTPGPWHADGRDIMASPDVCVAATKADTVYSGVRLETAFANARLIAAAPELLEALKGMIEFCWEEADYYKEDRRVVAAVKAIARAQGD